jgi:hypothetical protein
MYVAAMEERSGKRRDRMKLSLPPKLVEKVDWVPVIDVLLCQNWPFSPPNHLTLRITILYISKLLMNITHFFSSNTSLLLIW